MSSSKKRKRKKCNFEGCINNARNNAVCIKHGAYTKKCKVEDCDNNVQNNAVCIKHGAYTKKCKVEDCENQSKKNGKCYQHGAERKKCEVEGCKKVSQNNEKCYKHGAIRKPPNKCKIKACTNYALKNDLCHSHGARVCIICKINNVTYLDDLRQFCHSCYCIKYNIIPSHRKLRERYFNDLMMSEFPDIEFNYNISQPNLCNQTRYPDWSKDFLSHTIIVECDEKQHKHGKYKDCETRRTCEIYQNGAHRPVVFIRFNPDSYTNKSGKKIQGCFDEYRDENKTKQLSVRKRELTRRWNLIKTEIKRFTDRPSNVPTKAITEIKLFYDF